MTKKFTTAWHCPKVVTQFLATVKYKSSIRAVGIFVSTSFFLSYRNSSSWTSPKESNQLKHAKITFSKQVVVVLVLEIIQLMFVMQAQNLEKIIKYIFMFLLCTLYIFS